MSQKPHAGYQCTACGDHGNHWRVNCPVLRDLGPQHLFGSKKSRFYAIGGRPSLTGTVSWRHDTEQEKVERVQVVQPEPPVVPPADATWSPAELDAFPMRASCLQQNVMVADLSPELQHRVWAYVSRMVMPQNSELPRALATLQASPICKISVRVRQAIQCRACAAQHPTALRLKELAESIEAFAVIEAFLCGSTRSGRPTELIADCACGRFIAAINQS
eukprot:6483285-Pyramimonas_sp.AAC.1